MDFLDPVKRKAHNRRLFIGYILVAIVIGLVSTIIVLQLYYGYSFNTTTGQIVQNGLLFVSSHPVSSTVYIDGSDKGATSLRINIPAGEHTITLQATGYRTWQRTFTLDGATVEQLTYPFLFPNKLNTTDQQLYVAPPQLASQSPDQRWLLVQPKGPLTHFDIYDLSSSNTTKTSVEVPSTLLSPGKGPETLTVVEWSSDNRHVLLKHSWHGGNEFVVLDRLNPSLSFNINKTFNVNPTIVRLHNKKYNRYYFYDAKSQTLSSAELQTKAVSPLLTKIVSFEPFGSNDIVSVANDGLVKGTDALMEYDGTHNYLLHRYPSSASYQLNMADYSGHNYLVVNLSNLGMAYIYQDALSQAKGGLVAAPLTLLRLPQANFMSFSNNARFIAVQAQNHFAIYDLDEAKLYRFQIKPALPASVKATWMDGDRLTIANQNKISVFDFDGSNYQDLTASLPGFTPYFSSDFARLYNLAPSVQVPKRFALTATDLKAR